MILSQHLACNTQCKTCHYKDLTYENQLRLKQTWANEKLQKWQNSLQRIRPSGLSTILGYRTKTWLQTQFLNGVISFGKFRAIRKENGKWGKEFINWDTCPLHILEIQALISYLKKELLLFPEFVENSLVGVWFGSPHIVVVAKQSDLNLVKTIQWENLVVPPFEEVWFHQNEQTGKKIFGHHPVLPVFSLTPQNPVPIRAFRQVASPLVLEARKQAVQFLVSFRIKQVLDLYCGAGELSLLLPDEIGWLGIESSVDATRYANTLRNSKSHEAFPGYIEQRLADPRILSKIEAPYGIYLNPPRLGISPEGRKQLTSLLRNHRPKAIAYLSCSASSLSRDLDFLIAEGYSVERLQPYDFFPQTEHFEILAELKESLKENEFSRA